MRIKIITSSQFPPTMQNSFLAGLTDAGYPHFVLNPGDVVEEDGKYDDTEGTTATALYTDMTNADADISVNVIIAAGGLVSAHAANKNVKLTPFLVLVGQEPKFDMNALTYCGGVNLNMVDQNLVRHDLLVGHYNVDPKSVFLIWNSNSKMGKYEKRQWHRHGGWLDVPVNQNSEIAIGNAFTAAKNGGAKAVVVSGDPYFTAHMDALVKAANASQLTVCYPFSAYANAPTSPAPKVSMIFGPDIEVAYRLMGRKAGVLLDNVAAGSKAPDLGLEICPTTAPIFIGG
jgi:hypothetical protein